MAPDLSFRSAMSGALAALFFTQRSFLFPIPTSERVTPAAAGFPEAEEHVAHDHRWRDGSSSGTFRQSPVIAVILYFHGNGDFLAGLFSRFRAMTSTVPVLSRCPIAAMPARAGSRASRACCGMPPRPTPSRRRAMRQTASSSGAFRSAPASRWRWRPSNGRQNDPGSAVHIHGGYRRPLRCSASCRCAC